jgi:hypothetical protein
MACVYLYVIVLTLVGPEHLGRSFDAVDVLDAGEEMEQPVGGTRQDYVGTGLGCDHHERAVQQLGAKGGSR